MRPSMEARVGVWLLLGVQLLTSLGGVVLLGRMSPAVEQILTENVYSTEAVEEMLEVLATTDDPAQFERAFTRARGNITEAAEVPLLAEIEAGAPSALRGDADATAAVARALRALGAVNRDSMTRANANAERLGLAGAWAMALLGFLGFLVSLIVRRRIEARLLAPILEVDAVLEACRGGDEYRRCHASQDEAGNRLMSNLNWLLDRREGVPDVPTEDLALRAALVTLLDDLVAAPCVLLDAHGAVVAVNQAALDDAVRPSELAAAVAHHALPEGWAQRTLEEGGYRLLTRGAVGGG